MRFYIHLLGLAALASLSACDSTRETTAGRPNPTVSAAPAPPAPAKPGFRKELISGPYKYLISTTGAAGQRQLAVRAEQAGQELTTAQDTLPGEVQDALLAKLTTGPGDELLVFTLGPDGYGDVRGYWFGGQDWERMEPLPRLTGPAAQGYRGKDRFRVEGNTLVREFPVYLPDDAPCCPSGGMRILSYRMAEGSLRFRQMSVVNEAQPAQ